MTVKAGGEVWEFGRGSNAWSGAVDCIIAVRHPLNPARSTIREIEASSRRGDVPAEPVLIELTDRGFEVLGSEQAVASSQSRATILDVLEDPFHRSRAVLGNVPKQQHRHGSVSSCDCHLKGQRIGLFPM
jgi:hypothetical protein